MSEGADSRGGRLALLRVLFRPVYRAVVPARLQKKLTALRKVYSILTADYGYLETVVTGTPIDAAGNPLPWYTYPAIEYLQQLDFSGKTVFEYGCGNSTLFWGRQAQRVFGVEDDPAWYERIRPQLPPNCEVVLERDPQRYFNHIATHSQLFDVIVIDGFIRGKSRLECARAAIGKVAEGGLIIVDNSDWLPQCASFLRGTGLLEIDFHGLGPTGTWTWATSLFFHRNFSLQPKQGVQPLPGKGSLLYLPEQEE